MVMTRANEVIDISDDDENDVLPIQEHIWKQTLFKALNAIQAERELVSLNSYQEFVNPGLKIRGRQLVPLPLTDHYAEVIKDCAVRFRVLTMRLEIRGSLTTRSSS